MKRYHILTFVLLFALNVFAQQQETQSVLQPDPSLAVVPITAPKNEKLEAALA